MKSEKIIVSRQAMMDAIKAYDIGMMSSQSHWHLRLDPLSGRAWVSEDTSYSIGQDEFSGKAGSTITLKHAAGHGDWDTENFETPEDAANYAEEEGFYEEEFERLVEELGGQLFEGQISLDNKVNHVWCFKEIEVID